MPKSKKKTSRQKRATVKKKTSAVHRKKADRLYNLGVLANREGRLNDAIACYQRGLGYNSADVDAWYNLGEALARKGRYVDAHDAFAHAVSLHPEDATAWNNYGLMKQRLEQRAEARQCYQKAVALSPAYVLALQNLGKLYLSESNGFLAFNCFHKALEQRPGDPEIHCDMGDAFSMTGENDQALTQYTASIRSDGNYARAHFGMGLAYLRTNRSPDALVALRHAIRCEPENKKHWQTWAYALKWCPEPFDYIAETDLVDFLSMEGVDKRPLSSIVPRYLLDMESLNDLINDCEQGGTDAMDAMILSGELFQILDRPVARRFLVHVIATDPCWEVLLVHLRSRLLALTRRGVLPTSIQKNHLGFTCALANQCFLNEYIYHATVDELNHVRRLLTSIIRQMKRSDDAATSFCIALVAAYLPLFKTPLIEFSDRIAAMSGGLAELIEQQIRQPLLEQHLSDKIECITTVDNRTSIDVRAQYEENPYPRWKDAGYQQPTTIQAKLNGLFRHVRFKIPESPTLLVAGCGTGRHAIACALSYPGATITALDLSRASLAYGKRKALELNLTNVTFVQGDLLNFEGHLAQYDMIECVGVLHHLEDPMLGWRILRNQLKAGGLMKVGLYSRIAREHVEQVRQLIVREGYEATPGGIREFRSRILRNDNDSISRQAKESRDFYALSACRDLFFHVKEHHFTLVQIESMLEALSLEFMGFESPSPGLHARYREYFPEDGNCTNLGNWQRFESVHPTTFAGMYQFWVRDRQPV